MKHFAFAGLLIASFGVHAAGATKRVVIIKLDGVPEDVLEREVARIDPLTHKSTLPWIDRVFFQGGTRIDNFYVRAISLSTPSWSLLDTGQHLEIRGNAEFDRYTGHVYDYMNFFPFYVGYARSQKVDMPGVEVLDDQRIPLLIDYFPYPVVYQSFQLYQRGVRWDTLKKALPNRLSRGLRELLDEWTIGFELGSTVEEQTERDLIAKLSDPSIRYLDYFTGDYDHVAHAASDIATQRRELQRVDALIGRVWTAIQSNPLADDTALIAVSDHGMNTQPGVYSQGYNLLNFFGSRAGGGHHVVTNRHPLDEFKLSGLDPFVSEVVTPSNESLYLKGEADDYPTLLLDPDGNERASVYMRNSVFNMLQVLLQEIDRPATSPRVRVAAIAAFLQVVEAHRSQWQATLDQLTDELAALRRAIEKQRGLVESQPKKWTAEQHAQGLDKQSRRLAVQLDAWRREERTYSAYARALSRLLTLEARDFDAKKLSAEDLIPKRAMGDANSLYDLQNYVVGPAAGGLVLADNGALDFARSFERIDYPPLLARLAVRNNVQPAVGSHPVDFLAMRVAADSIWLYGSEDKQVLIQSRDDELRYVPIRSLRQDSDGSLHYDQAPLTAGFPLRFFEDASLAVPAGSDREAWLTAWHSGLDWLRTTHRAQYSDAMTALEEQFRPASLPPHDDAPDATLMARFDQRRRRLSQPDFLIFANDHWNFNVRNFNPGGNHGSFLRASTHAILLFAGGAETGIPRGREVEDPYDSLSFAPTVLDLMGMNAQAAKLPGRAIQEVLDPARR
ncbi:MAG TPA: alkaline phosphatase family protein [Bryobacteraceae bacterium]|nr:alkaline phosphatase family protein [Bryobacteraceae bacterium]